LLESGRPFNQEVADDTGRFDMTDQLTLGLTALLTFGLALYWGMP
jgi:hypothetical protein